jgi:predicted O-linked N-acetylglucosamine transferase (SPINDLY family)
MLAQAGRYADAAASFAEAVRLEPLNAQYHHAYGLAIVRLNRFQEALEAFKRAVDLHGNFARGYSSLGVTLLGVGQAELAIEPLTIALTLDPTLKQARESLLKAYSYAGSPEQALTIVEGMPIDTASRSAQVARAWAQMRLGRMEEAFEAAGTILAEDPVNERCHELRTFCVHYVPGQDAAAIFQVHRAAAEAGLEKSATDAADLLDMLDTNRTLRVGLVSGDLRQHAVGFLTIRAVEALAKLDYEIYGYPSHPSGLDDAFTERYRRVAKAWRDIAYLTPDDAKRLIRDDRIDILFDLSGLTNYNRVSVFARRAAPIQVTWAGYTGTTGLQTMDAIICDEREIPPGEDACYTERPLRLPDCYVCWEPPDPSPAPAPAPNLERGHITFGCFQKAAKISAPLIEAWGRILAALPGAKLELRYTGFETATLQERFRGLLDAVGVVPDRVTMTTGGTQYELLDHYRGIDIALDAYPYSGGVTTLESCWMGVPVVGWAAPTFAGRHSLSHLTAMGLGDLVAADADSYVQMAVALARDSDRLAAIRAGLRARLLASPLCDAERFAWNLDQALRVLIRQHQPPGPTSACLSREHP